MFACAKEFGWTAHYVLNEIPVYWLRKILEELGEHAKAQNASMKGEHYARAIELSDKEKERRDRLLAKLEGKNYDELKSDAIFG